MEEDTLIDKATRIIHSDGCTKDDLVEISRVEFDMAVQYYKAMRLLGEATDKYNKIKSDRTVELRKAGLSMAESTETAKQIALDKIPDLTEMEKVCNGFKEVISSVRGFKIAEYVKGNETEQYNNSGMKDLDYNN
ncbi:MAG: hypothetical protein J6S85_09790 [Methanobrevibacter sp.]|nr:hypothetical protein [Methanobrevibacter sp.]